MLKWRLIVVALFCLLLPAPVHGQATPQWCGPTTGVATLRDLIATGEAWLCLEEDGPAAPPAPLLIPLAPLGALPPGAAMLVAAGDIAGCAEAGALAGAEATAKLLDGLGDIDFTVAALGDLAYESGTSSEFRQCYDATWGRFKSRTRPAPGNHEYGTSGAAGYFGYFGAVAGEAGQGYYSYDLGRWHVVVLNSNCAEVGGCAFGSAQQRWLRQDLLGHPSACSVAYWHHPRFSSSRHGSDRATYGLWQTLYNAGAELVLSGHDHTYERFAPQDADGNLDRARGIRQFVAGTGGRSLYLDYRFTPNSERRILDSYGVLRLLLMPRSYEWSFIGTSGETLDSGTGACH